MLVSYSNEHSNELVHVLTLPNMCSLATSIMTYVGGGDEYNQDVETVSHILPTLTTIDQQMITTKN